jgi:hypothetical protein|tara:strand:+ start:230 stop:442 length:213 start_codon:yes stop_codon:yes gene_type:complete
MENNKTFTITFTKLNGESTTRKAKWTDKCREFKALAGHMVLTFLDLDATERYGKDQYRNATDKITPWSIS